MARQEQDEKVTSLSKEINEAMAEVEEQRSVKEKLQQQYDSLRGQYTHREEQNKRKIASLSRDLKEESRQLKAALAEGDELRDAASQLHAARAPQSLAAFRLLWPAARPAHRVPCLRPSAVRDGLQPAAQLGHVPRHGHGLHVLRALLPVPASQICSRALSPACCARTAIARRVPPPGPQPAPRTVCPACDPRQYAMAFNQPLSWDTSRVTNMYCMFLVRCSPPPRLPNL